MNSERIRRRIRDYIQTNFVYEEDWQLRDDQSLHGSGLVDSAGILEIISFTETEFQVQFLGNELVASNFDTIERMTACVERKLLNSLASCL